MSNLSPPSPSPVLRLNNLYAKAPSLSKISATVDSSHYDYFIRHILAGEHGAVQAILSHFWHKFYSHCKEDAKLPAVWNTDNKNPSRIAEVLSHLNFHDDSEQLGKLIVAYEMKVSELTQLQNELSSLRSLRPGRTNSRPAKSKVKPIPSNGHKRGTRSGRAKVQNPSGSTQGPEGNGNEQSNTKAEGGQESRQQSPEAS